MQMPSLKDLLEAGVHFGHQAKRWNPKMKPFIFTEREGIHVLDLEQTSKALENSTKFLKAIAKNGGKIIFVSTKEQAQIIVKEEATRCGALYVTKRWVGGTLTNFESLKSSLNRLNGLEKKRDAGELDKYTKKERLLIDRDIEKKNSSIGGLKGLVAGPQAIFVLDTKKEENAVREAKKTGVPIVGIVDTNSDPTVIDYPIPANDDAIKSIKLLVKTIADAVEEGYGEYKKEQAKSDNEERGK